MVGWVVYFNEIIICITYVCIKQYSQYSHKTIQIILVFLVCWVSMKCSNNLCVVSCPIYSFIAYLKWFLSMIFDITHTEHTKVKVLLRMLQWISIYMNVGTDDKCNYYFLPKLYFHCLSISNVQLGQFLCPTNWLLLFEDKLSDNTFFIVGKMYHKQELSTYLLHV